MFRPCPKKIFEEKFFWSDKLAQKIADFMGNIWLVWIHTIFFSIWIIANIILRDNG